MQEFLDIFLQYAPYIAIPLVVAGLVQSLKTAFKKFFKSVAGARLLPFIPVVLGTPLGLLLPLAGWGTQLLVGAALGTVSSLVYKALTVTLAKKAKVEEKLLRKEIDVSSIEGE